MADKKWIQGAIKHPGGLTARAKAAHETLAEYEAPRTGTRRSGAKWRWRRDCSTCTIIRSRAEASSVRDSQGKACPTLQSDTPF